MVERAVLAGSGEVGALRGGAGFAAGDLMTMRSGVGLLAVGEAWRLA